MSLAANATLTFTAYAVTDEGIVFTFVCGNPGAGEPSEYTVLMTDAELSATTTQAQLRTALTTKLQRRYRAQGIATRLDPLLGSTITI